MAVMSPSHVPALVTIGEFSRITNLSVKTLRHYHDTGLLEPEHVDPSSGYRYYDVSQAATAQVIRRLRDLDLPIERLRTFLGAPDEQDRNAVIVEHLDRMSTQLSQTQETVDSLRRMLSRGRDAFPVSYRDQPAVTALAISETVAVPDAIGWGIGAFRVLHRALRTSHTAPTGHHGALFPTEFFTEEAGEVVAYVPVDRVPSELPDRVVAREIPGCRLAVTLFEGPALDLDLAYGALGRWVAERAISSTGPIREHYLPVGDSRDPLAHTTEVCWPVVDHAEGHSHRPPPE
jgi:DNA-binding transcriptional MerR regulator/effector-binding domain-containing protein